MSIVFLISFISGFIVWMLSFTRGKGPLRSIFYFWVFSFLVGPRGIYPFGIRVFFVEGITWMVFFMYLFRLGWPKKTLYPRYTAGIFIFFILGIFTALYYNREITTIIYEFKVFLLIIPVFYITYIGIIYLNIDLEKVIKILCSGSLILALVGILFFMFPSITKFLPKSWVTGESVFISAEAERIVMGGHEIFIRGGGGLWNFSQLAIFFNLVFPISYVNIFLSKSNKKSFFSFIIFLLIIIAIIVSGKRSVWLGVLVGALLFSLFYGYRGIFLLSFLTFLIVFFIPEEVIARFFSIFEVSDISWTGRVSRYKWALKIIEDHPFLGFGWGGSGWVHNFVLQMGANLGVFAVFLFIIWMGMIIWKGFLIIRKIKYRRMRFVLIGFLIGSIVFVIPLLGSTVITLPNLIIPFWFFLAVVKYSGYYMHSLKHRA